MSIIFNLHAKMLNNMHKTTREIDCGLLLQGEKARLNFGIIFISNKTKKEPNLFHENR